MEGDRAEENLALLGRCLVFQALDEPARRALAARAYRAAHAAGEPIFHLGDAGESMMIVVAGTVRITLPTRQGKDIILTDVGPGEVFGEVALLDGRDRSASATALAACDLLVLDRKDVLPFLRSHPEACLALIALLCRRLRRSDERMTDIALSQLPARLAKTLMLRTSDVTDERPEARVAVSQSDLADMVGAARESVNRHLRTWHQRGILELQDGWIVVKRRDALAALAEVA